jgi:hypothetical protein
LSAYDAGRSLVRDGSMPAVDSFSRVLENILDVSQNCHKPGNRHAAQRSTT